MTSGEPQCVMLRSPRLRPARCSAVSQDECRPTLSSFLFFPGNATQYLFCPPVACVTPHPAYAGLFRAGNTLT
eukprot:107621-Pelagomonas_calceolata.AAC.2